MKGRIFNTKIILITTGVVLFFFTYLYYPYINKPENSKQVEENIDLKYESNDEITNFNNVEYKGLYNLDKPFKITSEKAYILKEKPEIVYMRKMVVTLDLGSGRIVKITSDKGSYNKITYDCFFQQNVEATDGGTKIIAENLDLLSAKNLVEIYNDVELDYVTGSLKADKINYNFETKNFKISMFDDKAIKMKIIK